MILYAIGLVLAIISLALMALALVFIHGAGRRVTDADARRFRALELLNEEQMARERDQVEFRARLHAVHTACLATVRMYRAAFDELAKQTAPNRDDDETPAPRRVM